jgi:hypothetical protein
MPGRGEIQIDLIKLAEGGRLLRVSERQSGLSLDRKIDNRRPCTIRSASLLRFSKRRLRERKQVSLDLEFTLALYSYVFSYFGASAHGTEHSLSL